MLRLLWRREAHDGDEDMDGVDQGGRELDAPPPPRGRCPSRDDGRVGIPLDPCVLLGEDVKKGARGWTRATVREFFC